MVKNKSCHHIADHQSLPELVSVHHHEGFYKMIKHHIGPANMVTLSPWQTAVVLLNKTLGLNLSSYQTHTKSIILSGKYKLFKTLKVPTMTLTFKFLARAGVLLN